MESNDSQKVKLRASENICFVIMYVMLNTNFFFQVPNEWKQTAKQIVNKNNSNNNISSYEKFCQQYKGQQQQQQQQQQNKKSSVVTFKMDNNNSRNTFTSNGKKQHKQARFKTSIGSNNIVSRLEKLTGHIFKKLRPVKVISTAEKVGFEKNVKI